MVKSNLATRRGLMWVSANGVPSRTAIPAYESRKVQVSR
jgi:hypothetical protein